MEEYTLRLDDEGNFTSETAKSIIKHFPEALLAASDKGWIEREELWPEFVGIERNEFFQEFMDLLSTEQLADILSVFPIMADSMQAPGGKLDTLLMAETAERVNADFAQDWYRFIVKITKLVD